MIQRIITEEELHRAIEGLFKDFEVIGPKDLSGRGIFYETLKSAQDLYLGENFTIEPVKKFFLSPWEWVLQCQYKESKNSLEDNPLPENKRIILGVRPCEARGLELLDKVYNPSTSSGSPSNGFKRGDSEYKDDFYIHNRKRTLLVGFSCVSPDRGCFCTSMGGSNVESRGLDALIFSGDEGFILEIITDKGKEALGGLGREMNGAENKAWEQEKNKRKELVKTKIKVPQALDKIFASPYWEEVSQACLSCGICTFLCPTCHCFDLVEEQRKKLRCYDGCAFPDFTLETSGFNPRPTKKERYRQRVFHKFDFFKKNFGENLCVACGRCIRSCPVKINIAEIVDKAPV